MAFRKSESGFTLIELLVVVAMIMLLAGALTSAIAGAAKRAKIQACITEAQNMTNAILAYENYTKNHEIKEMNDQMATKSSLPFIVGDGKNELNGEQLPVLYNGKIDPQGRMLDPWGRPFYVTIRKGTVKPKEKGQNTVASYVLFPNFNRRPASEVEPENE